MPKSRPRIKRVFTASGIAERIGITPQYVGMLLSGKRRSQRRLDQIRDVIGSELAAIPNYPAEPVPARHRRLNSRRRVQQAR